MAKVYNLYLLYKISNKSYQFTFYTKDNAVILRNYLYLIFGKDVKIKIRPQYVSKK